MKRIGKAALTLLAFLALFAFGFGWRDVQQGKLPSVEAFGRLLGLAPSAAFSESSSKVFRQAFQTIRDGYYKPVDSSDLKYAGLAGMMAALGDPHTQFLEPRATKEFLLETRARFAGVGARLSRDPLGARVESIFPKGPAERAGLRREDLITGVNGKSVVGKEIDDIVKDIRGKEGTLVTLQVMRSGVEKPLTIRIRREQVVAPTVESKMLPGSSFGYVAVTLFSEPTGEQFADELRQLERRGMRGLVVDLRGNPGGLLESAADVLSLFVEDKVVVKMRGRDGNEEVVKTAKGAARAKRLPVAILINKESASAAEIFAGVMRDYRMATLVGEHTYGKASVQNVIPMIDGASAKITVAKYFLPSGQDISRKVDEDGQYLSGGIEPDVEAPFDFDEEFVLGNPERDFQLSKAVEVLMGKLGSVLAVPSPTEAFEKASRALDA